MKYLIILLLLSGCSITEVKIPEERPLIQTNKKVTLNIFIEDDFSRFGENVAGAWLCKEKGACALYLPRIQSQFDSYGWCMWGHMLGRSVFGQMSKSNGVECADYYKR